MPTPAEGRVVIKKVFDNVRNFFPALLEIDTLLAAVDEAEILGKNQQARLASLTSQVTTMEKRAQEAALAASAAQERMGVVVGEAHRLDAEYQERRALLDKYGQAETLDAQIAEKSAQLAAVTAAFEQFKAVHNLS